MLGALYPTKKALKDSIGKSLNYLETSMFGTEYKETGTFAVVGPDPYRDRKWFATVTMEDDIIKNVK